MIMKTSQSNKPKQNNLNIIAIIFTISIGLLTTMYGIFGLVGLNNYSIPINILTVIVGLVGIVCGIVLFQDITKRCL